MAVRNLLSVNKLEAFEAFLRAEGYMVLPVSKNPYEVLRAKRGKDTVILYRRSDAREHLSVQDKDFDLVQRFLHGKAEPEPDMPDEGLPWD